jgi:hypothetical protein
MADNATAVLERLEEIRDGIKALSQPVTASQVEVQADGAQETTVRRARHAEIVKLRQAALFLPRTELKAAIRDQLEAGSGEGAGIPFAQWAAPNDLNKMMEDPTVRKLLDTASGNVLIRQDLEPLIYAAFVRRFPAFARVDKVPANGLVHTFQRVDARPTASYIAETANVPDSASTYTRATTNIAVLALRVGTSLKETLAIAAGGMAWNAEQMEITFGIESIAARAQQTLLQGNSSVPSGGADNDGPYDGNAFDGVRRTVPAGGIRELGPDTILEGFNQTDFLSANQGASGSVVYIHAADNVQFTNELQPFRRFVDSERVDVVPGLPRVTGIQLANSGLVPVVPVPGSDWAAYDRGDGVSVRDAFILDESVVAMPYLGSDTPTVIELPLGVTGSLTKLYILVWMGGLAVRVPNFISKLRIPA